MQLQPPLHAAAFAGNAEMVRFLLDTGAFDVDVGDRFGGAPIEDAITGDHDAVVRLLIERGADIYRDKGIFPGDAEGLLHQAVLMRFVKSARVLLENGADVNQFRQR